METILIDSLNRNGIKCTRIRVARDGVFTKVQCVNPASVDEYNLADNLRILKNRFPDAKIEDKR